MKNRELVKRILINTGILCFLAGVVLFLALVFSGMSSTIFDRVYMYATGNFEAPAGDGSSESPYIIDSEGDFLYILRKVNYGKDTFAGKYIKFQKDIDFLNSDGTQMVGAGEDVPEFLGIIDGNGHTISNINIVSETDAGLFYKFSGTIANLNITKSSFAGESAGAFAAINKGTIINCSTDALIEGSTVDGIAGQNMGRIVNCVHSEELVATATELNNGFYKAGFCDLSLCKWDKDRNFSDDRVLSIKELYTIVEVDGKEEKINAFFDDENAEFRFVFPKSVNTDEVIINALLTDGTIVRNELRNTFLCGEVTYNLDYMIDDSTVNMFVHTDASNGYEYMDKHKENRLSGDISLYDEEGIYLENKIITAINGRGNDSWLSAPKKGYSIKLKEADTLFNLDEAVGFNLLAAYRFNCMSSYIIFRELDKDMKLPFYHDYKLTNLYVDGEYLGVFFLTEKMEIDKNRFDIDDISVRVQELNELDLDEYPLVILGEGGKVGLDDGEYPKMIYRDIPNESKDLTGGYLFEVNSRDYSMEEAFFSTDRGTGFVIRNGADASKGEIEYSKQLWQDYEDALYSPTGKNSKGKHFTEYIDITSFADQWIQYELSKETSMSGSVYYYKDSDLKGDGLIHAVWLWDAEHSFTGSDEAEVSWVLESPKQLSRYEDDCVQFWTQIYEHKEFREALNKEWNEKYLPSMERLMEDGSVYRKDGICTFDYYKEIYVDTFELDTYRWPSVDGIEKLDTIRDLFRKRVPYLTGFFEKGAIGE